MQKARFSVFMAPVGPISTSLDLLLTESAVPDETVMSILQDPDPVFLCGPFGAYKRPFTAFSGMEDSFGMLRWSILSVLRMVHPQLVAILEEKPVVTCDVSMKLVGGILEVLERARHVLGVRKA